MTSNSYAPPKAVVDDVVHGQTAQALWNPNAAANWSLLFSPVFGPFLHMKNWQALGEPAKAATSKRWVFGALATFVRLAIASALPPVKAMDGLSRVWLAPLGLAIVALVGFVLAVGLVGFFMGMAVGVA